MTRWGKFLSFIGKVKPDNLEWILHRVKDFNATKRKQWQIRANEEKATGLFDWRTHTLVLEIEAAFERTQLYKVHGWSVECDEVKDKPELIDVWLYSNSVDCEIKYQLYCYDHAAFIKACDGKGGMNLDELNWLLERATKDLRKGSLKKN